MSASNQPSPYKIFITYRREDSQDTVGRIYDHLKERFGRNEVFKDVDSIPAGYNFPGYINHVLSQCRVALVVIGPIWATVQEKDEPYVGQIRLNDPADRVRIEVERALALAPVDAVGRPTSDLLLIPLLVQGARMPDKSQLPESLRELTEYNAAHIRRDPDFARDIQKLISVIAQWIGDTASYTAAPPPIVAPPTLNRRPASEDDTSSEDDESDWGHGPLILRVARVLACGLIMVMYWLLMGYATLQLFYAPILRISRAPLLIHWLSGSGIKVELVKTVALVASLAADWLLVGTVLSRTFHVTGFPVPYDASILAIIAAAVWLGVCVLYAVLLWRKWPYTNVFNCRKVCLVTFVTLLEILATQIPLFGPAFLYFPIFATMVSVGVYLYLLISLGGTSFDEWGHGRNAFADSRNEAQKARERRGAAFFERREARKRGARHARASSGGE